jgi:uncharacterized membrane protein
MVLALHLTAISLFGAMIVATEPHRRRNRAATSGKAIGFILAAACGFILFAAKAEEYYYNVFFRTKMLLFVLVAIHALVFHKSVYADSAGSAHAGEASSRAKLAAALSLVFWIESFAQGARIWSNERSHTVPGSRSRDLCHCMDSCSVAMSKGGWMIFNGR